MEITIDFKPKTPYISGKIQDSCIFINQKTEKFNLFSPIHATYFPFYVSPYLKVIPHVYQENL
ncbi:hypothetical protein P872_02350 [Rhodonellum psychrophilum GCM71 = DSM 17998]|uniref:Uncharacterized protein n=2 Tax=Rhodonellum TaxID=336827 RepID=U5C0P3_9BACT|nr:hypothetical protein P872_02350 [Rhodonellum psychrophilum GCM71 = DSM 17998]SDY91199.1 hypothetical protein SAMN05444412_103371 [Rhodonellum ikkaensis]